MTLPLLAIVALLAGIESEVPRSDAENSGPWRENGKVVPDTPWRKGSGRFGAMLFLTDKPDEFFSAWEKPAAPGYAPHLSQAKAAKRGETVVGVVLFSGCRTTDEGMCNAEVDFKVLRPDGSVYAKHRGRELWRNRPAPRKGSLQLGVESVGLEVELDDPLGEYRIEAVVRDKVAGTELHLVRNLEVLPATVDQPAASP